VSTKGSDSRFFSTTKKGEIHELRDELNSPKLPVKRDAIKKVIAAMTVGKEVSSLFPEMINSMQTGNLELKKLVYLFVINYSKSQPDLAVMGVNTFRRDCNDPNPLIRALAIRTMGCVRVDKIVEYLCEPLRRCLKDDDPYVRKTAAICVAKLFDLSPELCDDQGFIDMLRETISDANPAVVANAVAALSEIAQANDNPDEVFEITPSVLHKLLAALNECSEWGQVFILDSLGGYAPKDGAEAESIIERVTPRLQHSNAAVVMGACKVVVRYLDLVPDVDTRRMLAKKLAPPLITLISTNAPEIQYVALRNIQLIVASRPDILHKDIKVFFCKFNDPLYVKMEKLEVLILLVRDATAEQVLGELKEYASEVDVEFVRRSVRAIGRTAIKLERTAERCVNVLIELIKTRVNYVVQEAIVTIKDIFRRYPNRYESVISILCENLESLDEPMAKTSMIWIVGENAERIDNAGDLLETFVDSFFDEVAEVQLQLLTAVVKLFLVRPESRALMERVLKLATEESDNPDLRDRAFIYWRLLSSDPEAARTVVLAEKPVIEDDLTKIDDALLTELLEHVSSLASVYHKPARSFCKKITRHNDQAAGHDDDDNGDDQGADDVYVDDKPPKSSSAAPPEANLMDLLDMPASGGEPAQSAKLPVLLAGSDPKAGGLAVSGHFVRRDGAVMLDLQLENEGPESDLGDKVAIKLNKNTWALMPAKAALQLDEGLLLQGTPRLASFPMKIDPANSNKGAPPSLTMEVAMKIQKSGHVSYFNVPLPFHVLFLEGAQVPSDVQGAWTAAQAWAAVDAAVQPWPASAAQVLSRRNVVPVGNDLYTLVTTTGSTCLVHAAQGRVQVRCAQKPVLPYVLDAIVALLRDAAGGGAPAAAPAQQTGLLDLF